MGRPSMLQQRRTELVEAYRRVLAESGHRGATVARVAATAGLAPGLVHHYFRSREALDLALLARLVADFRGRTASLGDQGLDGYLDAALALGRNADRIAARAWVGVLAHALTDATAFERVRVMLDGEIERLDRLSGRRLGIAGASATLAFVLGCLVFGAFAPRRVAGFAAPAAKRLVRSLLV